MAKGKFRELMKQNVDLKKRIENVVESNLIFSGIILKMNNKSSLILSTKVPILKLLTLIQAQVLMKFSSCQIFVMRLKEIAKSRSN